MEQDPGGLSAEELLVIDLNSLLGQIANFSEVVNYDTSGDVPKVYPRERIAYTDSPLLFSDELESIRIDLPDLSMDSALPLELGTSSKHARILTITFQLIDGSEIRKNVVAKKITLAYGLAEAHTYQLLNLANERAFKVVGIFHDHYNILSAQVNSKVNFYVLTEAEPNVESLEIRNKRLASQIAQALSSITKLNNLKEPNTSKLQALQSLINKHLAEFKRGILASLELIERLHKLGRLHGDPFDKNFIYDKLFLYDRSLQEYFMCDFETSRDLTEFSPTERSQQIGLENANLVYGMRDQFIGYFEAESERQGLKNTTEQKAMFLRTAKDIEDLAESILSG